MAHQFSFFRAGGLNQVNLAKGADLINLDQLDQKLWVALACPTQGLVFDERTLALIDSDGDGRIRVNELTAALKWASALLVDPEILVPATDTLPKKRFPGRLHGPSQEFLSRFPRKGDTGTAPCERYGGRPQ